MKYLFLLIIIVFSLNIGFSQIFIKTNDIYKLETGIEPGGSIILTKDRKTYEKNFLYMIELNPYIGYFPFRQKNFSAGIKGEYIFMKSNLIALPPIFGAGVYIKYIYPITLKYKLFKKIRFYNELSYSKLNFTFNENVPYYEFQPYSFEYPEKTESLKYSDLCVNAGISINVKNGFYINIYEQYINYIKGEKHFTSRFSFSYILKEKTKKEIIIEKNKKSFKEYKTEEPNKYFLNYFVAGTSLTYIYDNSHPEYYPDKKHFYKEYTWNINFAAIINKRITTGIQVLNLFTEKTFGEKNNYNIYGIFSQYDFFPKLKTSLFGEMSVNIGDYCTCGTLDPIRKKNIWYYGFGGGAEFPLKKISEHLFFDLSFINYIILNKIKTKYNYTQYIIGLNYHFGKKQK